MALEYDLSCIISGKIILLLPENMILHLRWKMKDDLLKKIHVNMIFSSNFLKRWSFQKGPRRDVIILLLSGEMVFLSQKHDILSLGRKWEMTFLKKYMEIWYFLCTRTGVTNVVSRPSGKKYPRSSYRAKIHLKMIGVLDWYPRAPAILRTFMETFTGISCIALQRKKPGNLIYRIEVWLLLQFIRLEIFCNE